MEANNGKDIYEYTMKILFETCKDLDKFSQRLLTISGSNAILINFATSLDSCYPSLMITKVLSIVAFIISLTICLIGILPTGTGDINQPIDVADNLWGVDKPIFYSTIIEQCSIATIQIKETIAIKSIASKKAIIFSVLGTVCFAINSILHSFISCSQ